MPEPGFEARCAGTSLIMFYLMDQQILPVKVHTANISAVRDPQGLLFFYVWIACVCVCMSTHMHAATTVFMYTFAPMWAFRGLRLTSLSILFIEAVSQLNPELINIASLTRQFAPTILCLHIPCTWTAGRMPYPPGIWVLEIQTSPQTEVPSSWLHKVFC